MNKHYQKAMWKLRRDISFWLNITATTAFKGPCSILLTFSRQRRNIRSRGIYCGNGWARNLNFHLRWCYMKICVNMRCFFSHFIANIYIVEWTPVKLFLEIFLHGFILFYLIHIIWTINLNSHRQESDQIICNFKIQFCSHCDTFGRFLLIYFSKIHAWWSTLQIYQFILLFKRNILHSVDNIFTIRSTFTWYFPDVYHRSRSASAIAYAYTKCLTFPSFTNYKERL